MKSGKLKSGLHQLSLSKPIKLSYKSVPTIVALQVQVITRRDLSVSGAVPSHLRSSLHGHSGGTSLRSISPRPSTYPRWPLHERGWRGGRTQQHGQDPVLSSSVTNDPSPQVKIWAFATERLFSAITPQIFASKPDRSFVIINKGQLSSALPATINDLWRILW